MFAFSTSRNQSVVLHARLIVSFLAASVFGACSSDSTSTTPAPVTKPPAQEELSGGNSQTAPILTTVPQKLIVEVVDSAGNPDPGVHVVFATTGDGRLSEYDAYTDDSGLAEVSYMMGTKAGTEVVTATVPGITGDVEFDFTATPMPAATIGVTSGGGQSALAGTTLATPIVAQVLDQYGNGVPGVAVTWATSAGSIVSSTNTTDANGNVSATIQLPATSGAVDVTVTLPNVTGATAAVQVVAQ